MWLASPVIWRRILFLHIKTYYYIVAHALSQRVMTNKVRIYLTTIKCHRSFYAYNLFELLVQIRDGTLVCCIITLHVNSKSCTFFKKCFSPKKIMHVIFWSVWHQLSSYGAESLVETLYFLQGGQKGAFSDFSILPFILTAKTSLTSAKFKLDTFFENGFLSGQSFSFIICML